jgi:type VI secretion system protein ImpM
MGSAAAPAVGFFGKLPARGDFVRRDLPQDFVDAWDGWLAAGIAESKARLGADWLAAFLEAPVWNFALAPGVAGPAIAGIFLPSVDRAGRYFPLTIAAATAGAGPPTDPAWFAALAAAGVAALAEDATLEGFEAAVAALPPPASCAARPFAGGMVAAQASGLVPAPALFWTQGGARVAASFAALPALPPPDWFDALLADRAAEASLPPPPPPPPPLAAFAPPGGPTQPSLADTLFGDAP